MFTQIDFTTVLVALIASAGPIIIFLSQMNYHKQKEEREREDLYRTVLLEKRVEVHQEAYSLLSGLLFAFDRSQIEKQLMVDKIATFWNQNNLLLHPNARSSFNESLLAAYYELHTSSKLPVDLNSKDLHDQKIIEEHDEKYEKLNEAIAKGLIDISESLGLPYFNPTEENNKKKK